VEKHNCIRPPTIKAANAKWIANTLLFIMTVDLNISNEALDTIIKDKFGIKPSPMKLWRERTKTKSLSRVVIKSHIKDSLNICICLNNMIQG
jgi:hypothetical protein